MFRIFFCIEAMALNRHLARNPSPDPLFPDAWLSMVHRRIHNRVEDLRMHFNVRKNAGNGTVLPARSPGETVAGSIPCGGVLAYDRPHPAQGIYHGVLDATEQAGSIPCGGLLTYGIDENIIPRYHPDPETTTEQAWTENPSLYRHCQREPPAGGVEQQQQELEQAVQRAAHSLQVAYDQWQLKRDELTAFHHHEAVARARRAPPSVWTRATDVDIAEGAVFVYDGIRNLRD